MPDLNSGFGAVRFRPPLLVVFLVTAFGLTLAACSSDPQTGFTPDNESGFMAACTAPIEDSRMVSGICQCVFEEIDAQIPFSRFSATDDELVESPELEMPQEITDIIAQCVIEEAEL